MTDMTVKTPWHLWVVGVVGVLWNAFGCWDYTMTQLKGEEHLRSFGMTDVQIAYFDATPAWAHGAWAIGVWGGVLGAVLLLVRRKWAFHAFVVSFLGWLAGIVYAFGMSNGMEAMGSMWPMQIVIGAACVFFIWYANMMSTKGVLR